MHERRNIIVATSNLASVLKSSKKILPLRRYAITASETNNWHVSTHSCNVINSWSTLFLRTTSANLSYDVVKEKQWRNRSLTSNSYAFLYVQLYLSLSYFQNTFSNSVEASLITRARNENRKLSKHVHNAIALRVMYIVIAVLR